MNKNKIVIIVVIALLLVVNLILYSSNKAFRNTIKIKEAEFGQRLKEERESIRSEVQKDLEEKYRADLISYKAMVKKLALEQESIKKLQQEVEELKDRETEKVQKGKKRIRYKKR